MIDEPDPTDEIGRRIRAASATVHAPPRLHARVAEEAARRAATRRRRLALPIGALAGAAAVAAAVVVIVVGSGGTPSIQDAVGLALRPPSSGAPAVNPADPRFVQAEVGGVRFPNYRASTGWRPVGARTDTIDGRRAVTVAYRDSGGPVSYTIVDGAPLDVPKDAPRRSYERIRAAVLSRGSATAIVWEQGGHSCVLAGRFKDIADLLKAAAKE
jgi:hypothetical protein